MGARDAVWNGGFRAPRNASATAARGRALARMAPSAAIRIPERVSAQLALVIPSGQPQIYVHEGARQSLYRRLSAAFQGAVTLSITDNRHSIVSHGKHGGVLNVRVHHMFLDAPARVLDALV